MGSTMKVGSEVTLVWPATYVSSPTKRKEGYLVRRVVETMRSTAWSVSVTMSAAVLTGKKGGVSWGCSSRGWVKNLG